MKTQSGRGQNGFGEESSSVSVTVSAGNVGSQAAVTYTRGVDLSGTLQGAGGIGGLLARTDMGRLTVNDPLASAYYHADGNGNITALVTDLMDTNQVLVAKYLYDPYGNLLAESGPLAGGNKYRFSSKEWDSPAGLYYYLYRFYDPNLQRWPNRDPMGEPGFETLHLVTQPLFIRKLRLNINDSEMQFLLANAIQSGRIDISSYLRNSHTSYLGNTMSVLGFFNLLRSQQGDYAPYWPVELLENSNLFDFVGNDPIDGIDLYGEHWLKDGWNWTHEHIIEPIWIAVEHAFGDKTGEAGTGIGALKCAQGIYQFAPGEVNLRNGILTNSSLDFNPPLHAGGDNNNNDQR